MGRRKAVMSAIYLSVSYVSVHLPILLSNAVLLDGIKGTRKSPRAEFDIRGYGLK